MKYIAVLLTVFNRKEKTLACLGYLAKQQKVENLQVDVWLVNDGCTDGTPETVKEQFPEVHVIDADGNLYWNRGMYTAWKTAAEAKDYDYYLWLNDDTFVRPQMLQVLTDAATQTNDVAIIVGATCSTNNPDHITYGGRKHHDCNIPIPNGKLTEVDFFNGNIVFIPCSVYNKVGNLDYYFTHSKGDFDFGLRAAKSGIEIYQAGEVLGECDEHPTIAKWCNSAVPFRQRWRMLYRPNGMPPNETFHFERRHYGIVTASLHFVTVHLRCLCPWLWKHKQEINYYKK